MLQEMVEKLGALDQEEVDLPVKPCSLDGPTQNLIKLIFDQDMFKTAMQNMEIGKTIHQLQFCSAMHFN